MAEIIDKIAWFYIKERKLLVVRSYNKDKFYAPGGKREGSESDEQTLIREIKEELGVNVKPETIRHVQTFKAQAHGLPDGVMVQVAGYSADFEGTVSPQSEIEELTWFTYADMVRATEPGKLILTWLKEQNLID
ncbi:NUDIX domain-containing protein [Acetobacteraceae bacterium]|nr:NUDIX domain-containing protein [Candidatus Parcubacteria bacterium]